MNSCINVDKIPDCGNGKCVKFLERWALIRAKIDEKSNYLLYCVLTNAVVAQLDRAVAFLATGRGFDSRRRYKRFVRHWRANLLYFSAEPTTRICGFDIFARRVQRPSSLGHCRAEEDATKHGVLCESRRRSINDKTQLKSRDFLKVESPARRRE